MKWYVYLAICKDNTFYTGVTKDLERRLFEHNNDNIRGSKYIRARRPARLVYTEVFLSKSDALRREDAIKNWTRKSKSALISRSKIILGP